MKDLPNYKIENNKVLKQYGYLIKKKIFMLK